MADVLTGEQIARLEALLAKATPGPWTTETPECSLGTVDTVDGSIRVAQAQEVSVADRIAGSPTRQTNADLIAEAINALPALLQLARAELNRQRARANEPEWCPRCFRDVLNFWRDDDGIPRCTDCGAKIVALVPVPVKEGK